MIFAEKVFTSRKTCQISIRTTLNQKQTNLPVLQGCCPDSLLPAPMAPSSGEEEGVEL